MPNVFIPPGQIHGETLVVSGGDALHLARVLRLGPGDRFSALDGTGAEYQARITAVEEDRVVAVIESAGRRRTEPRLHLTLGQALPKAGKMEQVIRKCTELGLAAFWPLLTERCVAIPRGERAAGRVARWRRIASEAARQSGRTVIPPVEPIRPWREIAGEFARFDLVLLPWEGETATALREALDRRTRPASILALIGPEGGLTHGEVALAREAGAVPVSLGPRILRTETAGLVVGAAVFYHYGELGPADPG